MLGQDTLTLHSIASTLVLSYLSHDASERLQSTREDFETITNLVQKAKFMEDIYPY
jgi:hypothetical protein